MAPQCRHKDHPFRSKGKARRTRRPAARHGGETGGAAATTDADTETPPTCVADVLDDVGDDAHIELAGPPGEHIDFAADYFAGPAVVVVASIATLVLEEQGGEPPAKARPHVAAQAPPTQQKQPGSQQCHQRTEQNRSGGEPSLVAPRDGFSGGEFDCLSIHPFGSQVRALT